MKQCPKSIVYHIVKIEDIKNNKNHDSKAKRKQKSRN